MSCRAARGAVTAENTRESILEATEEMLSGIMEKNDITKDDIISVTFSCTADLTAVYPAVAARAMGITDAALFCVSEMNVTDSLEKCVRAMVLFEKNIPQNAVKHAYLRGAAHLRPDL